MAIDELKRILATMRKSPRAYFGDEIDDRLKEFLKKCHPDRFVTDEDKAESQLMFTEASNLADSCRVNPTRIKMKSGEYVLETLLASGDVSDVYLTQNDCVAKVSRVVGADKMLAREHVVLSELIEKAGDSTYKFYLPRPVDTLKIKDKFLKQINVFEHDEGGYTLEQIHDKYQSLDGVHLAWIFKRILTVIGFAHRHGYIHNAVLPCHLMIYPGTHGAVLLDWKLAGPAEIQKTVSAKYRQWYPPEIMDKKATGPASDIYMAAQCLIFAAGGDPTAGTIPASVPKRMATFINSCRVKSMAMRPQDAWELSEDFTRLLASIYGTPKFHSLSMS